MGKQVVDSVLVARYLLPMAPDETVVLENHAVVMDAGLILGVLPVDEADEMYEPRERIERLDHVVLPGLINAHTHTGMTLMRGRGDDQPLLEWLHETVWPIETAFASSPEFSEDGALLSVAEMLRGGITSFSDMYWFPEAAAKVALKSGMRAVIGMIIIGFPSAYATTPDDYIEKGHAVRDKYAHEPTLHFTYAPHAPYTVPDEVWEKLQMLSSTTGAQIHTHLHETKEECVASLSLQRDDPACHMSDHCIHPIANFDRMGLLTPNLVAAHMIHLTDDEIALCAARGVHVAHCASSNAKLASGFCPVHKLLAAGVNVALGTDSAASNNSLNMFGEMRMAALVAKNMAGDARVVPASTALKMATINAARALGISDVTGSLEIGKAADCIAVEVETHAGNTPLFNVHSALVYAGNREDVTDVFVNGEILVREKKLVKISQEDVLKRTAFWKAKIKELFPKPQKTASK